MTDKEKESATGTPAENSKTSKAPESTPDAGKKDRLKACLHRVFHRKERDNAHYITTKESNRISRENLRITRMYEKKKRRHVPESEYLTEMRDPHNIVEFDDLHTYFFTDTGVVKAVNGF